MIKDFQQIKDFVLNRAKELNACSSELQKVVNATTYNEIMSVIHLNASWVSSNKMLTDKQSIEYFGLSVSNLLNSGYSNSGNWNSGDRNSGDSNSGYRNSGAFCTEVNPRAILFNQVSELTVREWENHEACRLMSNIDFTIWVQGSIMTTEEKAQYPKWETTDGYLKTIPHKEAWSNFWNNLSEEKRNVFKTIPNWNKDIFEEITGIKFE